MEAGQLRQFQHVMQGEAVQRGEGDRAVLDLLAGNQPHRARLQAHASRVDYDRPLPPLQVKDQIQPADRSLDQVHPRPQALLLQPPHHHVAHAVIAHDLVADANDDGRRQRVALGGDGAVGHD